VQHDYLFVPVIITAKNEKNIMFNLGLLIVIIAWLV